MAVRLSSTRRHDPRSWTAREKNFLTRERRKSMADSFAESRYTFVARLSRRDSLVKNVSYVVRPSKKIRASFVRLGSTSRRRSGVQLRRLPSDVGGGNSNGSPVLFHRWNVCDTRFLADSAKLAAELGSSGVFSRFSRRSWPRVREPTFLLFEGKRLSP